MCEVMADERKLYTNNIRRLEAENDRLRAELERRAEPPRPAALLSRDDLGRIVRRAWVRWAKNQPQSRVKGSWLIPWEELDEFDREADRCIGESVAWAISPPRPEAIVLALGGHGHAWQSNHDAREWLQVEANSRLVVWSSVLYSWTWHPASTRIAT